MHWEALVVFVVSHVVPPLCCSGGLSNQQLFWKEIVFFGMFGHSLTAVNLKCFQPAHKLSVRHYDTLPTSCFVTSWSAGALLERFLYCLGIVLGIVLRGLHLCQSYVRETGRIACRGLPKPG